MNDKKIIILWASIRSDMLRTTWYDWLSKCSDSSNVHLKIAVANEEQKIEVDSFNFVNCEVEVIAEKKGYNYAITKLTQNLETEDDSILLLLSDDFFAFKDWDLYLYRKFENYDGALFLNDGYQDPKAKVGCLCITLACMTFACLKKLNKIVFHPDYKHFFSDNEAFINLSELGLLKDDRETDKEVFDHRHYVTGKRQQDQNDVSNLLFWQEDKDKFYHRLGLTIDERLGCNG